MSVFYNKGSNNNNDNTYYNYKLLGEFPLFYNVVNNNNSNNKIKVISIEDIPKVVLTSDKNDRADNMLRKNRFRIFLVNVGELYDDISY